MVVRPTFRLFTNIEKTRRSPPHWGFGCRCKWVLRDMWHVIGLTRPRFKTKEDASTGDPHLARRVCFDLLRPDPSHRPNHQVLPPSRFPTTSANHSGHIHLSQTAQLSGSLGSHHFDSFATLLLDRLDRRPVLDSSSTREEYPCPSGISTTLSALVAHRFATCTARPAWARY